MLDQPKRNSGRTCRVDRCLDNHALVWANEIVAVAAGLRSAPSAVNVTSDLLAKFMPTGRWLLVRRRHRFVRRRPTPPASAKRLCRRDLRDPGCLQLFAIGVTSP